jgi:hypothetical protein
MRGCRREGSSPFVAGPVPGHKLICVNVCAETPVIYFILFLTMDQKFPEIKIRRIATPGWLRSLFPSRTAAGNNACMRPAAYLSRLPDFFSRMIQ